MTNMTRFLVLVSFLIVCLFASFSGQALAGVTSDNLSLDNFKLANSKPYDALAKAFKKSRQPSVSNSGTNAPDKKSFSKSNKASKNAKKSKIAKSKNSHKSSVKKSKTYKKAAFRQ
jgi:hypothetical protein